MLRLSTTDRTYDVPITVAEEEIVFRLKSISLDGRAELLSAIRDADTAAEPFGTILDTVSSRIVGISGYDEMKPRDVLGKLEHIEDLRAILLGIVQFCSLTEDERKNLLSSPGQSIPDSVRVSAEKHAPQESEPVSTTHPRTG